MARKNGVDFLGRVPIDTVLVGLLDAVSKGEVKATGVGESGAAVGDAEGPEGEEERTGSASGGDSGDDVVAALDGVQVSDPAAPSAAAPTIEQDDFPLLNRYNTTASAKVWRDIARGVVDGIEARKRTIRERLGPIA